MNAVARSVHSTNDVDIFPQGEISSDSTWYLDNKITFTQDNADYTVSMVENDRITFEHSRPANLQPVKFWSQTSPTNSQNVNGAPDLSYTYTKGPVIEVTDFDTTPYDQYEIIAVNILVAFHIPGALLQDQVRFSMNNGGDYHELVTYVNTQNAIDYMNGTTWSENITDKADWSWSDLQNLIVTLDYVSLGSTDDTQLDVDAVGFSVIVEYPWYGTEWASVESTSQGFDMPIIPLNFAAAYFDHLQISNCGLSPVTQGVEGVWTSEILTSQPGQNFGRIHFQVDSSGNYLIEVSESVNGIDFTDYVAVSSNDLIDSDLKPMVSIDDDIKDVIIEISNKMLGITPVFSGDSIVGVITDGDLRRTLLNNQEISTLKAKDIMSTNPQIIDSDTLASEALEIMKKNKISQLIVTNNNLYFGVIHIQSLIKEGIS